MHLLLLLTFSLFNTIKYSIMRFTKLLSSTKLIEILYIFIRTCLITTIAFTCYILFFINIIISFMCVNMCIYLVRLLNVLWFFIFLSAYVVIFYLIVIVYLVWLKFLRSVCFFFLFKYLYFIEVAEIFFAVRKNCLLVVLNFG